MADVIRALIVDDEPIARRTLRLMLEPDTDIALVGECDGIEALEVIPRERPDLVFLDVRMPVVDGFELLERVGLETIPAVVFVTAHERHALRAFDVQAVDYLLKPFDDGRFATMLRRVKDALGRRIPTGGGARTEAAPYLRRLVVRLADRITIVNVEDIDWIEAADYYSSLHVHGATHLLRRTMGDLDRALDPRRFFRLHRSTIVNLTRVREVLSNGSGDHQVLLVDGMSLRLARGRLQALQQRLAGPAKV